MSSSLARSFRRSASFVGRLIADELLLVPITRRVADLDAVYTLDGIGPRLWELLDGQRTVGELIALVVDEYEVGASEAEADVLQFMAQLESMGAIEEA
ncbi:MAG TPA: PqqD family protein [Anaerolineae bacterium]|nr:PqqD family protein [Anaerolineae bacterium]